jgi:chaperonin GroEL
MEAPIRQITNNAGEEASVILDKIKAGEGNFGFNAGSGEYVT